MYVDICVFTHVCYVQVCVLAYLCVLVYVCDFVCLHDSDSTERYLNYVERIFSEKALQLKRPMKNLHAIYTNDQCIRFMTSSLDISVS